MWVNGYGEYGNNYNFSAFTASGQHAYQGKVGFFYGGAASSFMSPITVDVDTGLEYKMSGWVRHPTHVGQTQYLALLCKDVDNLSIDVHHGATAYPTSRTTLAAPWVPGQATMTLTDGGPWAGGIAGNVNRDLLLFPYTNSFGYAYPDFTYSRHCGVSAGWTISGNVLTLANPNLASLRNPATGDGSWPAGTPITATSRGGSYIYPWSGVASTTWTNRSGLIGPSLWRAGTAKAALGFLLNYTIAGGSVAWSGLRFEPSGITDSGGAPPPLPGEARNMNAPSKAIPNGGTPTVITGFVVAPGDTGNGLAVYSNGTMTINPGGAGWWDISLNTTWDPSTTGYRRIEFLVNGGTWYREDKPVTDTGSANWTAAVTGLYLAVGDVVTFRAYQSSGGNLNMTYARLTFKRALRAP